MEMRQMMEMLLKEIKAGQEQMVTKMDANQAKVEAKMDANQAKADADRVQLQETMKIMLVNQAKAEIRHKDFLARMDARWNAWREIMNDNHDKTLAYQEVEARPQEKEPTSVDTKPEAAEERQVPVEDAEVIPVKGRKKRHRGKKQAAERWKEPEELTRGLCGSWMKLAAACRKVSCRATVARRRRNAFKNKQTQDGCQRRLAAARRGTSHHAEVVRKLIFRQADKKMPCCATVA
jgi:hypothetical protein